MYNILNEKYETAKDYSQIGRSLNFSIKKNKIIIIQKY